MHEIQFQLRPHSKTEAAPPGAERGKLPRVAEVLALAIGFDDMIRRGSGEGPLRLGPVGLHQQGAGKPDHAAGLAGA